VSEERRGKEEEGCKQLLDYFEIYKTKMNQIVVHGWFERQHKKATGGLFVKFLSDFLFIL